MANGGNHTVGLIESGGELSGLAAMREIPHRAVAADVKNHVELVSIDYFRNGCLLSLPSLLSLLSLCVRRPSGRNLAQ
jgi:hypothetical protein